MLKVTMKQAYLYLFVYKEQCKVTTTQYKNLIGQNQNPWF